MHSQLRRWTAPLLGAGHPYCSQPKIVLFARTARIAAAAVFFCGAPLFAQSPLPDSPPIEGMGRGQKRELEIGTSSSEAREPRAGKSESTEPPQSPSGLSPFDPVQPATFVPLTSKEKFRYAAGASISPLAFIEAAAKAGFYQETGFRSKYGPGAPGYFKQFGASWADSALRNMTGSYMYASLLHEDPRYFRRGQGAFAHRLGYAVSRAFVTRSDSGQNEFNWASVLGSTTSAGLVNIYLPANDRTATTAVGNIAWFLAGAAANNAIQEFMPRLYHHLNKHP